MKQDQLTMAAPQGARGPTVLRSQRRRWTLAGAAILIGTVVAVIGAVVAGELYLRLTRAHITPDTLRSRSLEYEATLFSRHAFPQLAQRKRATPSQQVEISDRGYRGRSFAIPKPRGEVRVVVLGGSSVFDMFSPEGRDWPSLVETHLKKLGHSAVRVINAGTPGHASFDTLGRFYAEFWMFEPDYVLLYHGWNDIKYFHSLTPENTLLRTYRPAAIEATSRQSLVANPFIYYRGVFDQAFSHSQLYVRLRSRYLKWRVGTPGTEGVVDGAEAGHDDYSPDGPRQFELNLRLLVAAARHVGAAPVLATEARLVTPSNDAEERNLIAYEFVKLTHAALLRAFADCDRIVFSVGRSESVPVLDLSGRFTGQRALFEDHVHTTAAGSDALATATADFLAPLMDRARSRRNGRHATRLATTHSRPARVSS